MKHTIKMANKKFLVGILATALVFGMMVAGCPVDNGGSPVLLPVVPTSVSSYYLYETAMAVNPSRAVVRAGSNAQIAIPAYLLAALASLNIERAADTPAPVAVAATFSVHPDDRAIAEIVGPSVGSTCAIRGLRLGSARIIVTVGSQSATMIIAVSPSEDLYTLPAGDVRLLGSSGAFYDAWWNNAKPDSLPNDSANYTSEPTYQIAWNWRNKGQSYGASGGNCGIDLLAYYVDPVTRDRRGWVRTTYGFGGWHYDLNGVTDQMTNGVQVNEDVTLKLIPEFVYDNGIPYLQITHKLTNTGSSPLTGQKFGASADIMLFNNDRAPLTYLQYGALMTNEYISGETRYLPTMKLRLVCQGVQGVDAVSTLWLGRFGSERDHVYDNERVSITAENDRDTALNFSYQNINLAPGETKNFVVRFTQVQ